MSKTAPTRIALYYEHLFPESRGGGERLYGGLAEAWAQSGAQVAYVTREHLAEEHSGDRHYDVVPIAGPGGIYDEAGVRSPAGAIEFTRAAFRTIRQRRGVDDCVVVSSTPPLLALAARAGLVPRRSTVLIVDWLEVWTLEQWSAYLGRPRGTLAWLVQGAAVWSTPTATCHSALVETRLRRIRRGLRVLRSPGLIDGSRKLAAPAERIGTAVPYALFVGRLIEDKNVLSIPAAIAFVRESIPDFTCVVVGTGPLLEAFENAVEELGISDAVSIRSGLDETELTALMTSAACLLHPSQREGYGLVVVEAASSGTPSVVLNAPDNAAVELVDEGVNGFVAQSTRADDLGSAVLRCVMAGPDLRKSTLAWYIAAQDSRSIHRTAARILAFIESELAGSSR